MKSEIKYTTLPVKLEYKDKIELAQKILKIYSELITPLTKRNIDILSICLLEDMNSEDFKEIVLNSKLGINSEGSIKTEFTRLKDKGLLYFDPLISRKRHLKKDLQRFADILRGKNKIALYIGFDLEK